MSVMGSFPGHGCIPPYTLVHDYLHNPVSYKSTQPVIQTQQSWFTFIAFIRLLEYSYLTHIHRCCNNNGFLDESIECT